MSEIESVESLPKEETIYNPVLNTVDSPDEMSVSSVSPIPQKIDSIKVEDDTEDVHRVPDEPTATPEPEVQPEPEPVVVAKEPEVKEPKVNPAVQKRFDELTKKRRETERELESERALRIKLEEELKANKQVTPPTGEPQLDDFETEAEYTKALSVWTVKTELAQQNALSEKQRQEEARLKQEADKKNREDEVYQKLDGFVKKAEQKYPGFTDLVHSDNYKISHNMIESIVLSDKAEEILHYFGDHQDEALDMYYKSPVEIAYSIGKIEAKLSAPPPSKKISSAPDPITPVVANSKVKASLDDDLPYDVWKKRRMSGEL